MREASIFTSPMSLTITKAYAAFVGEDMIYQSGFTAAEISCKQQYRCFFLISDIACILLMLFYGNRLGQVARHVYVAAFHYGYMVGQQLQGWLL